MKTQILILSACILFPAFINAQSIQKAKKQMDKFNYSKAIGVLKEASNQSDKRNAALPLMAECYRLQHDVANTRTAYAQVVTLPDAKPESYFYYAKALQSTGEYTEAREMYQKYAEKNPSDKRGNLFTAHCDSVLEAWKGLTPEFEIKAVNAINTNQSDFGPAFYNGELIYASDFSSSTAEGKKYGWTGRGYLNIMKSNPLVEGDFWGSMGKTAEFDSKFNHAYHDGPASFSKDGNTIFYTRSFIGKAKRKGNIRTNLLKIFYATKTNGTWGKVMPFFLNSNDFSVGHPTLSPDGNTLYFASDMPGGYGGTDIWMCKRNGDEWGKPENLGTIVNSVENEMFPSVREDGTLYFSSEGHPGYGAMDIFKTSMNNGKWSTPENLKQPINSSYDDFAIAFAPGTSNGFFSSNRPGGQGFDDIYAFKAPEVEKTPEPIVPAIPEPVLPAFISGFVKDKNTKQPIAGATVFLHNPATGTVKILKTDSDGMYKTTIDSTASYVVKAVKPEYIADCTPFAVTELKPGVNTVSSHDLLLDKLVVDQTFEINNIYYDFDKYNIREDAKAELDKLVRFMKENAVNVELASHTDSRGSFAYNEQLSQKRAESAVAYIISAGIDKNRITAKGYGERRLSNACSDDVYCTPKEHQLNRRTEFKITGLTAPAVNTDQVSPGNYSNGQVIDAKVLPKNFFNPCN